MKKLLFISILFCPTFLFSQTNEKIISDTAYVRWSFSPEDKDTNYFLNDYNSIGKWIVYYDKSKKQKTFEIESTIKNKSIYTEPYISTDWYRDGKIKSARKMNLNNDTLYQTSFFKNGKVKNKAISSWTNVGKGWNLITESQYYENGQIKQTPIDYTSPSIFHSQHLITYYATGTKHQELNFNMMSGSTVGEFKEYFENGKIKMIGAYLDPQATDPNFILTPGCCEKNGSWKYYNEAGILIKEELYENGKIIKTSE